MHYRHSFDNGSACNYPVGKIVCVGRNYAAHARELGNALPETPILFLKPATAIVPLSPGFTLPKGRGACHHETEVTVLVGAPLTAASASECQKAIAGIGIGLDLTLRDLQNELKKKGHPWEVAKAFDGAAPLSPFLSPDAFASLDTIEFSLCVNQQQRQHGMTTDMLTPIIELLVFISHIFTLQAGDVVMTGTPEGVAALQAGDQLLLKIGHAEFESAVMA